jgi:serine/threonine protein kinase
MMSDNTETSVPKLVDFGLAKMIGPNELALEPFGTLGYVAPEVL